MDKLKFGSFVWPNNPESIRVKNTKNIKAFDAPYKGRVLQNYGPSARVVTGEGEFYGNGALVNYFKLYGMFKDDAPHQLDIPGFTRMGAYLTQLDFVGEPGPGIVRYTFTFTEDIFAELAPFGPPEFEVTVAAGDTLWSIAKEYNVSFERLVELNPSVTDPYRLPAGSVIILMERS